jgi:hypothetical protein
MVALVTPILLGWQRGGDLRAWQRRVLRWINHRTDRRAGSSDQERADPFGIMKSGLRMLARSPSGGLQTDIVSLDTRLIQIPWRSESLGGKRTLEG